MIIFLFFKKAIQNQKLVHNSNGISVIFHSIIDFKPFNENFQDALIAAVTYLLTTSSKRQYVQPGDIRILIEPFTNTYESSEEVRKTRVYAAQQAVPKFLRSWTGLICFVNDECALPALVASLQLPDLKLSVSLIPVPSSLLSFFPYLDLSSIHRPFIFFFPFLGDFFSITQLHVIPNRHMFSLQFTKAF